MSSKSKAASSMERSDAAKISLFDAALPTREAREGTIFHDALKIPMRGKPTTFQSLYKCNLVLARLMLTICHETAEDLLNRRYRHFDALVRNFGCQITALQNYRIIKQEGLDDQACSIKTAAEKCLEMLDQLWVKPPISENGVEITNYLKHIKIDLLLSRDFAQLVRFKILNIVNTNVLIAGEEKPKTMLDRLICKTNECVEHFNNGSRKPYTLPLNRILHSAWIDALQTEESKTAISFVQRVGHELVMKGEDPRAALISKMLSDEHIRTTKTKPFIDSLPQLYTGESTLKSVEGIVLVKNKTLICGIPRKNAKSMQVFINMAEKRVLLSDEAAKISNDEPIVVLEGYVDPECSLEETVQKYGIIALLNATLVRGPQYATGSEGDFSKTALNDLEAVSDINNLLQFESGYRAIQFDHIYCASMAEERYIAAHTDPSTSYAGEHA